MRASGFDTAWGALCLEARAPEAAPHGGDDETARTRRATTLRGGVLRAASWDASCPRTGDREWPVSTRKSRREEVDGKRRVGSGCVCRALRVSGGVALCPGRAVSVRAAVAGCTAKLRRAERRDACGRRVSRRCPERCAEVGGSALARARARKLRRQPLIPYSERSQRPLVSVLPEKVRQTKVFRNMIFTKLFGKPTRAGV